MTVANFLKAKRALNLTDPNKIVAVGPCPAAETPESSLLLGNLL